MKELLRILGAAAIVLSATAVGCTPAEEGTTEEGGAKTEQPAEGGEKTQ